MKVNPLINRHWLNAVEQLSLDNDRRANVIEHFSWRKGPLKMQSSNRHRTVSITQTLSKNIVVQTLSITRFTQMFFQITPSDTYYSINLVWQYQLYNCYDSNAVDRPPSVKCSWTIVIGLSPSCNSHRATILSQTLPDQCNQAIVFGQCPENKHYRETSSFKRYRTHALH